MIHPNVLRIARSMLGSVKTNRKLSSPTKLFALRVPEADQDRVDHRVDEEHAEDHERRPHEDVGADALPEPGGEGVDGAVHRPVEEEARRRRRRRSRRATTRSRFAFSSRRYSNAAHMTVNPTSGISRALRSLSRNRTALPPAAGASTATSSPLSGSRVGVMSSASSRRVLGGANGRSGRRRPLLPSLSCLPPSTRSASWPRCRRGRRSASPDLPACTSPCRSRTTRSRPPPASGPTRRTGRCPPASASVSTADESARIEFT